MTCPLRPIHLPGILLANPPPTDGHLSLPPLPNQAIPILVALGLALHLDRRMVLVVVVAPPATKALIPPMAIVSDSLPVHTTALPHGFRSLEGVFLPYGGAICSLSSLPEAAPIFVGGPAAYPNGIYVL